MTRFHRLCAGVLLAGGVLLSGCSTMYFDNGPPKPTSIKESRWHHVMFLALMEVSSPVDLNGHCKAEGSQGEWISTKNELTFLNWLASLPVNLFLPIWFPWTVEYRCE